MPRGRSLPLTDSSHWKSPPMALATSTALSSQLKENTRMVPKRIPRSSQRHDGPRRLLCARRWNRKTRGSIRRLHHLFLGDSQKYGSLGAHNLARGARPMRELQTELASNLTEEKCAGIVFAETSVLGGDATALAAARRSVAAIAYKRDGDGCAPPRIPPPTNSRIQTRRLSGAAARMPPRARLPTT